MSRITVKSFYSCLLAKSKQIKPNLSGHNKEENIITDNRKLMAEVEPMEQVEQLSL